MKRASFIAIAVVVIASGLLAATCGVAVVVTAFRNPNGAIAAEPPALQIFERGFVVVIGLAFVAFGAWATFASIALLRRRAWSRISVIVICGLCLSLSALSLIICFVSAAVGIASAARSEWLDGALFVFLSSLPVAFFIWAIIFLNKTAVKVELGWTPPTYAPPVPVVPVQFVPTIAVERRPSRPVLVAVIAWFMIANGALAASMLPFYFLWKSWLPSIVFGRLVWGWPVALSSLVSGAAWIAAGTGLLKAKTWGRILAIAAHVYAVANTVLMVLNGAQFDQFERILFAKMAAFQGNLGISLTPEIIEPFVRLARFSMLMGVAIPILVIWYLWRQKDLGPAPVRS